MNLEAQNSLRSFLYVIFKHKAKILIALSLAVLVIAVSTFLADPTYKATSQILVKVGRENVYSPALLSSGGLQPTMGASHEEDVNSEIEMLKGRTIAEKVIERIGPKNLYPDMDKQWLPSLFQRKDITPMEKAVLKFQKQLRVEGIKKSNVIEVTFEHKNAADASIVVNVLIDSFVEHHLAVHNQPKAFDFFGDQVILLQKKMEDSQKALHAFRNHYNISSLPEQKSVLLKQISELEIEQAKTAAQLSESKGTRGSLIEASSAGLGESRLGKETDTNVYAISNIKNKITDLRLKEEELLARYPENNHWVASIRKELQEARQLLALEEKTYHDKEVQTLNHRVKGLSDKQQTQTRHMNTYNQDLGRVANLEMQLRELERQLRIDEENYQQCVRKREEGRMFNAMDTEKMVNISVVQPALKPIQPVKSRETVKFLLAIVLGGVAGLGWAFTSEALNGTLDRREDIEKYIEFSVLGSIPHIPALKSQRLRYLPPAGSSGS